MEAILQAGRVHLETVVLPRWHVQMTKRYGRDGPFATCEISLPPKNNSIATGKAETETGAYKRALEILRQDLEREVRTFRGTAEQAVDKVMKIFKIEYKIFVDDRTAGLCATARITVNGLNAYLYNEEQPNLRTDESMKDKVSRQLLNQLVGFLGEGVLAARLVPRKRTAKNATGKRQRSSGT